MVIDSLGRSLFAQNFLRWRRRGPTETVEPPPRTIALIEKVLRGLDSPVVRKDVLSMRDVVDFFAKNRPSGIGAVSGAVFRTVGADLRPEVHLIFLDLSGMPMLRGAGRAPSISFAVGSLDAELTCAFGEHDVVVLD